MIVDFLDKNTLGDVAKEFDNGYICLEDVVEHKKY